MSGALNSGGKALKKMPSSGPFVASSNNISRAWAEVFLSLMRRGETELGPVVIGISEFDSDSFPVEDKDIRRSMDVALDRLKGRNVHDVATTIFPISLWNDQVPEHDKLLYDRFNRIWPRLKKRTRQNARGSYFQRLIAYEDSDGRPINQLDHIATTFARGNHRRSALQASIFDPRKDHTHTPQLGFPCLQQVAFASTKDGLEVTGYYVSQFAFDRAYGNYLGLCWLGRFMAALLGRKLSRVYCISSHLILDETKTSLRTLADEVEEVLRRKPGGAS